MKGDILVHPSYGVPISQYAAIAQARSLVWEVCDHYQKQTYRNRMHIATSTGMLRLSIPVKQLKNAQGKSMSVSTQIDITAEWKRDHWRSIKVAYQTSPFFEFYEDAFLPLYKERHTELFAFQMELHEIIMECLQLEIPTSKTTTYTKTPDQEDLRYLINAKQDTIVNFPHYHQVFLERTPFLPNLSVLDLIFNEGPNALTYLEKVAIIG